MALLSKKKLIPLLIKEGFLTGETTKGIITDGENYKGISYEAYGRKVMAYIQVKDLATRSKLENYLESLGMKPDRGYWLGHPVATVQVSYFKAWHWDE